MGDGDGIPTPKPESSLTDGNLLPSTSLSPEAQASLQSCREETDFDSYYAFLMFHISNDDDESWKPAYVDKELALLSYGLQRPPDPTEFRTPSDLGSRVLNISKDCKISMSAPHSDVHHTSIIEALCDPPKDAQLQIAVWSLSSIEHMLAQRHLIDYLGLHFSLDPRYLMAVRNLIWEVALMIDRNSGSEVERGAFASVEDRLDRYNPTHTKIGNAIITVCLPRDGTNGIPIVLIAQYVGKDPTADRYPSLSDYSLGELRRKQLHPRPPLRRSHSWESQLASLQDLGSYRYYPQMLTCLLESQTETRYDFTDVLLICFLPCLQLQLVRIRSLCGMTRFLFEDHWESSTRARTDSRTKNSEEQLYSHRTSLRREISDLESQWSTLIRYMKTRLSMDPSKGLLFKDFEEEIGHVLGESNRLESQIRDYLQLRAGTLGLEESRRSIDLSNRQIEEAKRGKNEQN
ncbi:MAG: hypothetical protein Q9178_007540 [Gyalolechia marmorata]